MSPRVVGLDLSLTATGVACIGGVHAEPWTVTVSTKPAGKTLACRWLRILSIVAHVAPTLDGADLVALEGPSFGSRDGYAWERAGLWWQIVRHCLENSIRLAEVPPAVVKKWATGRGNAGKTAVAVSIARLWPDVDLPDDNAADALALAGMAAQRLGLPVPSRAHHAETLTKVAWPDTNGGQQ